MQVNITPIIKVFEIFLKFFKGLNNNRFTYLIYFFFINLLIALILNLIMQKDRIYDLKFRYLQI